MCLRTSLAPHRCPKDQLSTCNQSWPRPLSSFTSVAEVWQEEGLAAQERSVLSAIAEAQTVDFLAMASQQQSCPEEAEMLTSGMLQITSQVVEISLLGDVSRGVFCPPVPVQLREAVFQSLHSIHHPGVQASQCLISDRFCWPQMAKAITLMSGYACFANGARYTNMSTSS